MDAQGTNSEFFRLLIRHLSGELTPEEELLFQKLIEDDPENRGLLEEYSSLWEKTGLAGEKASYDLDQEWELLRNKMSPSADFWDGVEVPLRPSRPARSLLFYSYRIAAVLVAGLLFAFAWLYVSRITSTELVLADNEPVEVVLGDGTKVTLNRDSRLRIPKNFNASERMVNLRGEAWFEVTPDSVRPFLVVAGDALVKVLGTKFNVTAYRGEPTVEVTVTTGLVALTDKQNQQDGIVLRAGNGGTYDTQKQELTLIPQADPNNLSWKTRELYFDNTPLGEVTEIINKVYHTHLVVANPELAACPITVTFNNQSLDAILTVLELTMDLEITGTGDEITLNGTGCVE